MINIQNYARPKTLEEAYELNKTPNSKIMGGMMWIRLSNNMVRTVIDLSDLNLNYIKEDDDQFVIGAYTSLRTLETHAGLNAYTDNAIKEAARHIVGTQFRNMATVGGSIFGRFGFSDIITVFMGLDTYVELYKGGIVSLREFVDMKFDNDILVNVIVKKKPCKVVYQSVRNTVTDFPVLTCCTSSYDGSYHVVIGARPKRAVIVEDKENLLKDLSDESIEAFASYARKTVKTESNMRGSDRYRSKLVKVLSERCLKQLKELM